MKKKIKYLILSVSVLCILIPVYFYFHYQKLPIYQIEYNAGEDTTYALHYAYFKDHTYQSVNPFIYEDEYPLGKQIGRTEHGIETVFEVKGHKDLIAVKGFMIPPIYFKEMKDLD
ncbi:hypothetical protein [Neobacillus sp. YIM B06451]|uniref:hypothetical protein n=1 Tax=Neobacillus sp. YIM B06451 TaxID=3070994 RepID=UPI00293171FC|nr:hypothetical protein [Neobacillus sp. YIM B06451]